MPTFPSPPPPPVLPQPEVPVIPEAMPQPKPLRIGPVVIVGILGAITTCRMPGYDQRKKETPKSGERSGKVRCRPCPHGQSPIVTYTKSRRKMGTFNDGVTFKNLKGDVDQVTEGIAYHRKIKELYPDAEDGTFVDIEVTHATPDEIFEESVRNPLSMAGDGCWFTIWELGKRRHCKCPDGSNCRKPKKAKPKLPEGGYILPLITPPPGGVEAGYILPLPEKPGTPGIQLPDAGGS